jgi:hypothetical protein
MKLLNLLGVLFFTFVFFSCNSTRIKVKQQNERILVQNISIKIKYFNICYPHCLLSDEWIITDSHIQFINAENRQEEIIVIDKANLEVINLIDSIILISKRISNEIKPASYDCKSEEPGGLGTLGQNIYFNHGTNFSFKIRKNNEDSLFWYGYYRVFQCDQRLFGSLIKLSNDLIAIHSKENKRIKQIIEIRRNNCECKEFEIGRIFKD